MPLPKTFQSFEEFEREIIRGGTRRVAEPTKHECSECHQMRTGGQACEHCGACPECGSTDDSPPTFDCHLCGRAGTDEAIDWGDEPEDGQPL